MEDARLEQNKRFIEYIVENEKYAHTPEYQEKYWDLKYAIGDMIHAYTFSPFYGIKTEMFGRVLEKDLKGKRLRIQKYGQKVKNEETWVPPEPDGSFWHINRYPKMAGDD